MPPMSIYDILYNRRSILDIFNCLELENLNIIFLLLLFLGVACSRTCIRMKTMSGQIHSMVSWHKDTM